MKNSLKEKSTKELNNTLTAVKGVTIALITVLTLLVAVTTYGFFTKEDNSTFIALFAVAISCSAILPIQFNSMKKIRAELQSRDASRDDH